MCMSEADVVQTLQLKISEKNKEIDASVQTMQDYRAGKSYKEFGDDPNYKILQQHKKKLQSELSRLRGKLPKGAGESQTEPLNDGDPKRSIASLALRISALEKKETLDEKERELLTSLVLDKWRLEESSSISKDSINQRKWRLRGKLKDLENLPQRTTGQQILIDMLRNKLKIPGEEVLEPIPSEFSNFEEGWGDYVNNLDQPKTDKDKGKKRKLTSNEGSTVQKEKKEVVHTEKKEVRVIDIRRLLRNADTERDTLRSVLLMLFMEPQPNPYIRTALRTLCDELQKQESKTTPQQWFLELMSYYQPEVIGGHIIRGEPEKSRKQVLQENYLKNEITQAELQELQEIEKYSLFPDKNVIQPSGGMGSVVHMLDILHHRLLSLEMNLLRIY